MSAARNTLRIALGGVGAAFLLLTSAAYAQSSSASPPGEDAGRIPAGLSSCFEYYRFGSTPVSISGSLSEVATGANLVLNGVIENQNAYPIPDVSVYAKVFRKQSAGRKDAHGPDVVDRFRAAGPLALRAGAAEPISFTWRVPENAQPGEYRIATYVIASERFSMLGLEFTDDIVGSAYDFSVVGSDRGAVRFDKSAVTVNGEPFFFAAFPPQVAGVDPVTVAASVANTTGSAFEGVITWRLYDWDSIRPGALIEESSQPLTVEAGASALVSYVARDADRSVYYLVGEIEADGSKSLIGVRFVRSSVNEPRINFAGVSRYPLAGDSVAFLCAHNTSGAVASDVRMQVSVVPKRNVLARLFASEPASAAYAGSLSGKIAALTLPLPLSSTLFTLDARLYQGDALIDEVRITYDCRALEAPCPPAPWYLYAIPALALLALAFAYGKRKKAVAEPPSV